MSVTQAQSSAFGTMGQQINAPPGRVVINETPLPQAPTRAYLVVIKGPDPGIFCDVP
jgi:hypothetical protein